MRRISRIPPALRPNGGFDQLADHWPGTTPLAITNFPTLLSAALDINNTGQIVGKMGDQPGFQDVAFL